jgi:CRP-like cAMP-binding protein
MKRAPIDPLLAETPLFRGFSARHLRALSSIVTTTDVQAGRTLFRQGDTGREFLVVKAGTLEVRRDGALIATRGPGEVVGEIALLLNRPRTASVHAVTDATVAVIERRDFAAFLEDHPDVYPVLLTTVAERLAELLDR